MNGQGRRKEQVTPKSHYFCCTFGYIGTTKCSALFWRNLHIRCIFSCFFLLLTGHVYLHTLYKYLSTKTVTTTVRFSISVSKTVTVSCQNIWWICLFSFCCVNLCEFNLSFSNTKIMFSVVYVFCIWCVESLRKSSMEQYILTHLLAYWENKRSHWLAG